ncbi:ribonuclease D [Marinimicrobium alkaliphilum]|uniref:ribonuclease D n=1 Tax=Marinimicrobium alkaliphilum TaxID=2202654 RepID=UPI000DBACF59|nr:ribonuclease D [Marinimicrobium alkaliphilum]
MTASATIPTEPTWIASDTELAELCARWLTQGAIAIDTEFMRSSTFYPIAGLIQVGDGRGCYLIDPLAIEDMGPLKAVLLDTRVVKVLHSCSEDLEVFQRLLDLVPEPIFDTQIAAAYAGYGFSLGYAGLIKAALGLEIPKAETRSDWLQRPLSVAQMKYAALDVAHMLIIYGKLLKTLKDNGRLAWVREDCALLVSQARQPAVLEEAYRKVGLAWKLQPRELAVLQRLTIWREEQARARDIPRNRLVKEPPLWQMARTQPHTLEQLATIRDLPSRTVADDGETLLALIVEGQNSEPAHWPERLPMPLPRNQTGLMKALKHCVRERAEAQDLLPELVARKRDYEFIVRSGLEGGRYALPPRFAGWRGELVGESLLAAAEQWRQDNPEAFAPEESEA